MCVCAHACVLASPPEPLLGTAPHSPLSCCQPPTAWPVLLLCPALCSTSPNSCLPLHLSPCLPYCLLLGFPGHAQEKNAKHICSGVSVSVCAQTMCALLKVSVCALSCSVVLLSPRLFTGCAGIMLCASLGLQLFTCFWIKFHQPCWHSFIYFAVALDLKLLAC